MIYNIRRGVFGNGELRNGDLIAICNVVEHLRLIHNDPTIKFYIDSVYLEQNDYVFKMLKFLLEHTNYLSNEVGNSDLHWKNVNLWDYRDISGDLVKIPNNRQKKKKVVVAPLVDAKYNTYRNWDVKNIQTIIESVEVSFPEHEKILCVKPGVLELNSSTFRLSTDFEENLNHIMESDVYIGGDTGLTHFAFSLNIGPRELMCYTSSRGLIHTMPFYALKGKGRILTYWRDFEGTSW